MESSRDRIDRLKNKFRPLSRIKRLKEFVRYDRAKEGQLEHEFPPEYVEEVWTALWEILRDDFPDSNNFREFLSIARKTPSKPFIAPNKT